LSTTCVYSHGKSILVILIFSLIMMPDKPSFASTLIPRDWYLALFFVLLSMLLGSWYMVVGVSGVFHDDAIYISTAKALAEGRGYRLINLPEAPAQTKYPPLYPALLAIIWKIYPTFPDNLIYMQFLTLISGAAMAGLSYLYLVRFGYSSRGLAAGAVALTITSNFYMYFCTITLSELPFALFVILALWALENQTEDTVLKPSGQFFFGMLLSLPVLTRTIGMVLIPLAFFVFWKRKRPLKWMAFGVSTLLVPWLFWMLIIPRWLSADIVSTYYTNYLTWWYSFCIAYFVNVVAINIVYISSATIILSISLFNLLDFYSWMTIISIVLGFVTWFYIIKELFTRRTLPLYLISYLFIILIWPWPPPRFLVPILPFVLVYFLSWLSKFFQRAFLFPKVFSSIILVTVITINFIFMAHTVKLNQVEHYPFWLPLGKAVAWQSYENIFQWLRGNSQPGDVIASGLDTMIFLYTGRQAIRPFQGRPASLFYGCDGPALGSSEEVLGSLRHHQARYLVQVPMPGFSEEKPFNITMGQLLSKYPGLLRLVHVAPDSRFMIYEICPAQQVGYGK
jgi:hypothetical protein